MITQDQDVPFDVRAVRRIDYDAKALTHLQEDLDKAFNEVSARYPFEGAEPRY